MKKHWCLCISVLSITMLFAEQQEFIALEEKGEQSESFFSSSSIFVFGDSHSMAFAGIPRCTTYRFSRTMHTAGRDVMEWIDLCDFTKLKVQKNDIIIFSFGEVDVRCHIGKQRDLKGRDMNEVIHELVTNYIRAILSKVKKLDVFTIVYNVPPPSHLGYNSEFPFYGTLEDRVIITKALNSVLKDACANTGLAFLEVYDEYATEEGSLKYEISDGHVHIREDCNQPIQKRLFELLRISEFNKK